LFSGKTFKIHYHREIIARLRLYDIWTVLALQHVLCAVLNELREAFDGDGDLDL